MQAINAIGRRHCVRLGWSFVLLVLLSPAALAQQTRTDELEGRRAERDRAGPTEPATRIEKLVLRAEDRWLQPDRLPPQGAFYPRAGSVTVGGLLGFGPGYRRSFANDNLRADTSAMLTMRGYALVHAEVSAPRLVRHTLEVKGIGEYRHFPQEDFYGIGPDTTKATKTDFLIDQREYSVQVAWRPQPWLTIGSRSAWLEPRVGRGRDRKDASIETRFTDATAPGLTTPTDFFEQGGLLTIDYRDAPGDAHTGGRYVLYVSRFDDRRDRGLDFARLSTQVEHYVPIFDVKRVIALRVGVNHFAAASGSRVPFYYLTPFGGGDSVRAFDDLRFRDANSWIASAEYRWELLTGVGLALFYDRGGVGPRFESLSVARGVAAYGVAVRLSTGRAIFLRAEAAAGGDEGMRGFVGFSGPLKVERFFR